MHFATQRHTHTVLLLPPPLRGYTRVHLRAHTNVQTHTPRAHAHTQTNAHGNKINSRLMCTACGRGSLRLSALARSCRQLCVCVYFCVSVCVCVFMCHLCVICVSFVSGPVWFCAKCTSQFISPGFTAAGACCNARHRFATQLQPTRCSNAPTVLMPAAAIAASASPLNSPLIAGVTSAPLE